MKVAYRHKAFLRLCPFLQPLVDGFAFVNGAVFVRAKDEDAANDDEDGKPNKEKSSDSSVFDRRHWLKLNR